MVSLVDVAEAGDRVATLRALRDRIAADIDAATAPRDLAPLAQRLMDCLQLIADAETANPETEGTALDELYARRRAASRSPDTARKARAPRKPK